MALEESGAVRPGVNDFVQKVLAPAKGGRIRLPLIGEEIPYGQAPRSLFCQGTKPAVLAPLHDIIDAMNPKPWQYQG